MPIYEFLCATCGPFEQHRPLAEASAPMACPSCQVEAQRIYSTGGCMLTAGALRRRMERGVEPQIVTRPKPQEPAPTLQQSARSRPWQLGHAGHTKTVHPRLQKI